MRNNNQQSREIGALSPIQASASRDTDPSVVPRPIRNAIENLAGGDHPECVKQLFELLQPYFAVSAIPRGFTSWAGSDLAPVKDEQAVALQFRDGGVHYQCEAGLYSWRDRGMPDDIIAYKVATPDTPWTWTGDAMPPMGATVICLDDPVNRPHDLCVATRDADWDDVLCWWMHIPPTPDSRGSYSVGRP